MFDPTPGGDQMAMRDDDLDTWPLVVMAVLLSSVLVWGWLTWAGHRDERGMTRAAESVATTATSSTTTTAPPIVDRGWPADWPTRHDIGLIAWGLHHAQPEVEASSMAVERQPSGEIVVTNPPEAPIAHHGDEPEGGWTVWDRLAACESGDRNIVGSANWHINSGNGYSGGLQWLPDTWRRAGGHEYAPHAWQATREQQIAVAEAWLARTSWGQWPGCARFLGLR